MLEVLRAVEEAARVRRAPYSVGLAYLNLKAHPDLIDNAIASAHISGWLRAVGTPPHSVTITAAGKRLLDPGA